MESLFHAFSVLGSVLIPKNTVTKTDTQSLPQA
jgi:hypothetical protein